MPHSTNKELILAIMVGTAGISLLVLWYQKVRKPRTAVNLRTLFSLDNTFDSTTLQDKTHNGQGTAAIFQKRQLQILDKLNDLLTNMEELKEEIKFLKEAIPKLEEYIQDELGGKITVHRISPQHRARKRRVTAIQSSATTNNSSEEAESEGGYITANTDTEEQSFSVPKAFNAHIEELKLDILLQKADHLRMTQSGKMESFELLCEHKEKFKDEIEFIWRFARAYGDMFELSTDTREKKHYANIGKTLGEKAITRAPMNGHCHMWYAILCGCVSQFEGLQNKINYGYRFKEHLDIAIQLLPEEPFLYYLNGRYCYTVSKLSWIEKKMAATLFGKVPSSTLQEALRNFLKGLPFFCKHLTRWASDVIQLICNALRSEIDTNLVEDACQGGIGVTLSSFTEQIVKWTVPALGEVEEIHPGYSILNCMYLAKCYADLEENQNAWKFCNLALLLPTVTKEEKEAQTEVKAIIKSLKRVFDFGGNRTPEER